MSVNDAALRLLNVSMRFVCAAGISCAFQVVAPKSSLRRLFGLDFYLICLFSLFIFCFIIFYMYLYVLCIVASVKHFGTSLVKLHIYFDVDFLFFI